ncbi:hypothetical protein ACFLYA_01820 [Candidatus Dependentiae bacterium]
MFFFYWMLHGRSILRKEHEKKPLLEVRFVKDPSCVYSIRDTHLQEETIFKTFDKDFFHKNMLPEKISYKYDPNKFVTKKQLETCLEQLFKEIKQKNKEFTHFDILIKHDFNRRKKYGFMILLFKEYPFVAKVSIETPKSFVNPYSKGIKPIFFFNMGGGINRHLLGFTRVKNLQAINKMIQGDATWSKLIATPRKWYWLPKDSNDIELIGKNFPGKTELKTTIPGTYCIIADAIKLKNKKFSIFDKEAREMCMDLCNFLEVRIDPHIDNFLLEKDTNKIVIVDTEHFPSIVGFTETQQFKGYGDWYRRLATKCVRDMFGQTKKQRYSPE